MNVKRVILIVLDSVGIGFLPDATLYGDHGSNTLGHISEKIKEFYIPNLINMGLGNIDPTNLLLKSSAPIAAFGKAAERSAGKDTTTGHWEIAGTILKNPFPTFPNGFPEGFINAFEKVIGTRTIGNYSSSGTVIINQLGDEHIKTGYPIVYTSADSVFQVAMHEDVIDLNRQYEICQIARDLLVGEYEVGRVIARPFNGKSGIYSRTSGRKDFATTPPDNLLTSIMANKMAVVGIGKISDIFAGKGINRSIKTSNNTEGIKATIHAISEDINGLIFTNLVDFDMHFGHRRDVEGYAKCLEDFDTYIPELLKAIHDDDLLVITADHGNDPTWKGTDHTREYIPILMYGKSVLSGGNIGTRNSFADIAATIAEVLGIDFDTEGVSFIDKVMKE